MAESVLEIDREWAAPVLWRSEWRNVLAGYLRRGEFDPIAMLNRIRTAEGLLHGREHAVDAAGVMDLVARS